MDNKFLVIANWKMNLGLEESIKLASAIKESYGEEMKKSKIVLCPSFTNINSVSQIVVDTAISYGAQDVFWEAKGAYTGATSPIMLKELGAEYVIVGHSERRANFGETDEMVNKKVKTCLEFNLIPIICLGEEYKDRKSGRQKQIIERHIRNILKDIKIKKYNQVIVAYEPIWAISTSRQGKPETPDDADDQQELINRILTELYNKDIVENNFKVIYGGSVNKENILGFAERENIEGVLVGSASQNAEDFVDLMNQINKLEK